jgi:glutaredoxin
VAETPSPAADAADAAASGAPVTVFVEGAAEEQIAPEILTRRICDFDLRIEGRPLEKVIQRFQRELEAREITRLKPRFYLTDEWGVPEGTVAIGIPFYLADERLLKVQEIRGGIVEGTTEDDILRYLRHEMGHVVNYAYRLYESEDWTRLFGPMSRPYPDTYQALPFSPDYVRHLPGGYAQRHPDEDWAETFAVWMDPSSGWGELYSDSPGALRKLEYCEETLRALRERDPDVTRVELDLQSSEIQETVQEYYEQVDLGSVTIPHSLDGDLRMIFAPHAPPAPGEGPPAGSAPHLLRRQKDALANAVYTWTGVDPSILAPVVQHLVRRAAEMKLTYRLPDRDAIVVQLTGFLTALAMNHVYKGNFVAK